MVKPAFRSIRWLVLPLLVGACTAPADHPSLAPRAVERFTTIEPTTTPITQPAIPEDASRQERVSALVARAREADALFRSRLSEAQAAAARGAGSGIGSEAWVQAQQAVSRADVARTPVTQSLADLDALQIASAEAGVGIEATAALTTALDEVGSLSAAEDQAIAALTTRLGTP